jgi:molybdate transport system ATP-binding protein
LSLFIDIEKSFPGFKLSVRLDCEHEVFALLGGSGCGKSLTLKCVAGVEKPDRGRIVINGKTVFDSEKRIDTPPQKRHTGYLFQNYALFPTMTVWNNIFCVIKKPKSERAAVVDDIIKKFQLEGIKNLYPGQISGGQQQRAALARILVSEPEILLLDEPFSALDTYLKWRMVREITAILDEFKGTTIFVSHDRDEAYRVSGKIAVMNKGKIESAGAKEDIFNFPKTLAAALITGCKNISGAEKLGPFLVKAADWGITLKTNLSVPDNVKYLAVRAHHFKWGSAALSEGNCFPCRVRKIIEDTFKKTVVFSFDTGGENNVELQFEISKEICGEFEAKNIFICIPADKIMCLE